MSELELGFAVESVLQTPLNFCDITYANGQTIRYRKETKHGEWLYHRYDHDYECPFCNLRLDEDEDMPVADTWNFCPNCGASMRVKDELNRVSKELNSEIEKSKSEIVPDYRDAWRLKEGDEK